MNKGLLTLLLLFTCFARAQVVDTWQFANPQQQEQALTIASQLRCPPLLMQLLEEVQDLPARFGIQCAGGSQYAPSGLQHGGGGEK